MIKIFNNLKKLQYITLKNNFHTILLPLKEKNPVILYIMKIMVQTFKKELSL
jgi:hypothetical protein